MKRIGLVSGQVLLGLLLAFALIEISVRVFFPQAPRFYIADAYIKTIHMPDSFVARESGGQRVTMKSNAQGFIGDEDFTPQKPASTTRIAALGDSFTEGYAVDYHEVYPYVLEKELNASSTGQRYQVYNFGIAGTGTAHQLLDYQHYVRNYHPDLLVWQFYVGNDYTDNLLFSTGSSSPTDAPAVKLGWARDFFSNYLESPRFIIRRLETVSNVKKILAALSLDSQDLHTFDASTGYPFVYDIYNTATTTVLANEFSHTCGLANQLAKSAEHDAVPMLAIIIPTREELFPEQDWKALLAANPSMAAVRWDLHQPRQRIDTCLTDAHVPYIDLYPVFKARLAAGEPRMYYTDIDNDHVTPLGQQIIADTLKSYLATHHDIH